MSSNERFIDYKSTFFNYEGEEVKGLHIMRAPGRAVMISQRINSEVPSETEPFYLPDDPKELRKIAKELVEWAKKLEGKS